MDVGKPHADLEWVVDDFKEGEHEKLDRNVSEIFQKITHENLDHLSPFILATIAKQSRDRIHARELGIGKCEALTKRYPRIGDMILEGSKSGYRQLRLLKLLRPQGEYQLHSRPLKSAPERGWEQDYVGLAAKALWDHVQKSFEKASKPDPYQCVYAKYCPVVQSSGMGKSRAIDEMSKSHFVITVNLMEPESTGYPPGDTPAFEYLTQSDTQNTAFFRSCAFLHALFLQVTRAVKKIEKGTVADQFRDKMQDGMSLGNQGEWRTDFYENIVSDAELVYATYSDYFSADKSSQGIESKLHSDNFPLRGVLRDLCQLLETRAGSLRDQHIAKRRKLDSVSKSPQGPLLVLAFDEIHNLSAIQGCGNRKWSQFDQLRRALRGLMGESLFTLFVSSSVATFGMTPSGDPSSKTISPNHGLPPFYQLGFDQLVEPIGFSRTVTLSQITSDEHLMSFGRPLWRPYLRDDSRLKFAATKLLGSEQYEPNQTLKGGEKLACIAQRIPIEFLGPRNVWRPTLQEKLQVESRMRVVLKTDDRFKTLVTKSPSEPFLSEAAYFIMTTQSCSPPQMLLDSLHEFAICRDNLKELIVALLFVMARDKAVGKPGPSGLPQYEDRWCSVTELLGALFFTPSDSPDSGEHYLDNIADSHGWRFTPDLTSTLKVSLAKRFEDSKVYFTHFIKAQGQAIVQLEFLMHLMVRGAAVLCADGQPGNISGIIPFLVQGEDIRRNNIGVIMFQVQNDTMYTGEQRVDLVRQMDPHNFGIILGSADVPIIRFFFALVAEVPTLQRVEYGKCKYPCSKSYTSYDFWVSGLDSDILRPVWGDEWGWRHLLRASLRDGEEVSSEENDLATELSKAANPGVSTESAFWENWCEDVPW